jgi:hypothetical protein
LGNRKRFDRRDCNQSGGGKGGPSTGRNCQLWIQPSGRLCRLPRAAPMSECRIRLSTRHKRAGTRRSRDYSLGYRQRSDTQHDVCHGDGDSTTVIIKKRPVP